MKKELPTKTEEYLRILFENAPDAIYVNDLRGIFVDGNETAEKYTGYNRHELIGKSFLELKLLPTNQIPKAAALLAKNAIGKGTGLDEFTLNKKDGSQIQVGIRTYPVKIGGKTYILGIARDITERKRAEEELKYSKEFLEKVLNSLTDAVSIINVDDFTIAGVNTAFLQTYKYKEEEIIGKTCYEITHHRSVPCTAPDDICPLDDVITSGEHAVVEHLHHGKDGKERNVEISAFPITDENGETVQIVHVAKDITERKQVGEALKESKEKFFRAFHSNPHPMSIVTLEGGLYLDVNDSYVQTFGFSLEELLGRTSVEMGILKNDRARRKILQSLKERQAVKNLELELYTRSGRKVDALLSGDKMEIGGQTCLLSVITDITERKQAEDAVRESEERYRALLELNAEVGEAVVMLQNTEDKKAVHTFATREWSRITGYSGKELLGMSWFELLRPDYREAALERFHRRMGGEVIPGLFEASIVRKDGTEVPVEITAGPATYRGEFALVVYARDITGPKKAEQERERLIQELQETLKEVRTLSGLLPICAWCKKLRDDEGYWKSVEQYIGERTKAEFTHGMCPECQSKFLSERNSNTKVS